MSRPLIISDCDEVLLHMVVPFRSWLDAVHHIHFDFATSHFGEALRHKQSGDVVEQALVWDLLSEFFETEMDRQTPIAGAVDAMRRLSALADIVVLTNIGEEGYAGRVAQLHDHDLPFPVVCNRGGKGPALVRIRRERGAQLVVFIDDLENNHESVAAHAPDVWRLHMVGEPELAARIADAPDAHARIDDWARAEAWIAARLADGVPAPLAP